MKTTENDDGSISYTLSPNERMFLYGIIGFFVGRQMGYRKGRINTQRAIRKSGITQPLNI